VATTTDFAADRTFVSWLVGVLSFVFIVFTALALGFGLAADFEVWARLGWVLAGPASAISAVRLGRLLMFSVPAISLDDQAIILRFEPVRVTDRTVRKSEVAAVGRNTSASVDAIEIRMRSGKSIRINSIMLEEPNLLVQSLQQMWAEIPRL
jgi:hypothetical protein